MVKDKEKKGVFLKPIHRYAYRRENCGDPLVTGVCFYKPEARYGHEYEARLCYEVTYEDGFIDYVVITEVYDGVYQMYSK